MSSRSLRRELVHVGLSGFDRWLIEPRYAVHTVRQALAMPVNAGAFRQAIGDENAGGRPRPLQSSGRSCRCSPDALAIPGAISRITGSATRVKLLNAVA